MASKFLNWRNSKIANLQAEKAYYSFKKQVEKKIEDVQKEAPDLNNQLSFSIKDVKNLKELTK